MSTHHQTAALGTPNRQGGTAKKGHGGGLDFLNQHFAPISDQRSKSNYLPGQMNIGKIGYAGGAGNYGRSFGQGSVARVKKNLYETSRQISRYKHLNKTGSLANRLNRALPANTNFPETALREKMTSTGLETATKFKLSNAEQAMNSQQF